VSTSAAGCGRQGVDVADQDDGRPGFSGCEQELHEVVIAGDRCPVLVAGPTHDDPVVRADEADFAHVYRVVPGRIQVLEGDKTGRWYSRAEKAA
jgi:hypothetical protein